MHLFLEHFPTFSAGQIIFVDSFISCVISGLSLFGCVIILGESPNSSELLIAFCKDDIVVSIVLSCVIFHISHQFISILAHEGANVTVCLYLGHLN